MRKDLRKILAIIAVIVPLIFLFQNIDIGNAKDLDYPTKPINFYIPFGAGGTADIASRAFIGAAGKYIGEPFIPVNKPGAGGAISAMAVMIAKPDGYTLGQVAASNAFVSPFSQEAQYKDLNGFTMIMNFGHYIYIWAVRNDAPWKTWKEFIEWARKNPRAAKIGIAGTRSNVTQGLIMWQVEQKEQVEFTAIPLKSGAECLNATLGGHIAMYGSTIDPSTVPYLKEGRLRILAYSGSKKVHGYEDIPSFLELYGSSIIVPNLFGVFGPKGLPEYVLKKLDDAFANAVKDPDFVNVMNQMYTPIVYMDRIQMSKYAEETLPRVGEIMKALKTEEAKEKK